MDGFDPSIIVVIVLGLAFIGLVVAVVVRMSGKKAGNLAPRGAARGGRAEGDDDSDTRSKSQEKARRDKRADAPVQAKKAAETKKPEVSAGKPADEPRDSFIVDVSRARPMIEGLARTRHEGFIARLAEVFGRASVMDQTLVSAAEEALLTADMGVKTAVELTEGLRSDFQPGPGEAGPQVMNWLKNRTLSMIDELNHGIPDLDAPGLSVIMVVGVNGTGKTTNIAKLANWYRNQGKKVMLAAGDTFRAAGADQLGIWGERIGIPVVVGRPGQDPSALFFDAARKAIDEGFDILIADTAGRLHTDINLVEELKKVSRVFGKAVPGAPHHVLLMLDATMGQNAVRQADVFLKSVQVSGIGLSKLDGTARGGVVVSIVRDMKLPLWFVGVGETVDDIRSFQAGEFVDALFAEG